MPSGIVIHIEPYPNYKLLLIQDNHNTDKIIARSHRDVELVLGHSPWIICKGDTVHYENTEATPEQD
jgi:hypothetical protein